MSERLQDKIAIVVGAGQSAGETIGNGRATAVLFAREGARVLLVDRDAESLAGTQAMIEEEGGECSSLTADISREEDCRAIADSCHERYGRIDILHNNVGIGAGDSLINDLDSDAWDRIMNVNLKGMALTCKHVLPHMQQQKAGAIVNISSLASTAAMPLVGYKVSKAGVNALTHNLAITQARHNIRANAITPGLINTPMAVEGYARATGKPREEIIEQRNRQVPLGNTMGSAWDVAWAAVFLASDEARFITGAIVPVDGGQGIRIG